MIEEILGEELATQGCYSRSYSAPPSSFLAPGFPAWPFILVFVFVCLFSCTNTPPSPVVSIGSSFANKGMCIYCGHSEYVRP